VNPTAPNSQNPARDSSRSSWWIRVLSRVPLAFWYAFASGLAWLSWRLIPYRRHVVEANLKASFPEWSDAQSGICTTQAVARCGWSAPDCASLHPGFCNGPWLVNPFLRRPLAGYLLLYGIGAVAVA